MCWGGGITKDSPSSISKRDVWGTSKRSISFWIPRELADVAFVRPAKKIYEAPAECWAGFAPAASAPRLIFDFHLIFFFPCHLQLSVRRGEQRDEDGGWEGRQRWLGDPSHQAGTPRKPKVRASASVWGGGGRKGDRTGAETVGDSSQGLGGRCRPRKEQGARAQPRF